MKKILFICIFITIIPILPAISVELDFSVDEEIKKKYDTTKLYYEVPKLPTTTPTLKSQTINQTTYKSKVSTNITTVTNNVIPKGTKVKVKSNQMISDSLAKGTIVTFTTTEDTFKSSTKIPKGTTIRGKIIDSHLPQITGNGGLIVIVITSINYQGQNYELAGRVLKVNEKKAFFNNIKGKRKYWSNVNKQIEKGEKFYNKTNKVTSRMSNIPVIEILSFVPKVIGATGYCANLILSPITAIGAKGERISIPRNREFLLKL